MQVRRKFVEALCDPGQQLCGKPAVAGAKLYKITASGSEEVIPDNRDQGRLEDPRLGAFVEQAQRVVDRINGRDGPSFTTFEDGLWVQRVMDAIHRSSDERREVAVSEIV